MKLQDVAMIRQILPENVAFHYYPDRQSVWLLSQLLKDDGSSVTDIKKTSLAPLLHRPLVRPIVAQSGGLLRRRDLLATAYADRALRFDTVDAAGQAGWNAACRSVWRDFSLSFDVWQGAQTTRRQGNLVLQLGFPSEHARLMQRYDRIKERHKYQADWHPVRKDGIPTLAWARLDLELESGHCLIEEIQSDWLRFVRWEREHLQEQAPKSRELRLTQAYEAELMERYSKSWAEVTMLAVLMLLRDEFAIRTVWMHQPMPGAFLKGITWGGLPPRSIYSQLPRRFCFAPTREVPPFLEQSSRKKLRRLRAKERPLFWRLGF